MPGAKKPCLRWKKYQAQRPTAAEMTAWFGRWPDAGLAVILGPISGLFVIDVDGSEAHAALLERLGTEPLAPKALSGSRAPHRYHLFFRCPALPTKAKATPWHPNLEFRGARGILVLPPSLHKSGHRYEWAPGQSINDLALPLVPVPVLEALTPAFRARSVIIPGAAANVPGVNCSPRTRQFLSGIYANGPQWNDRLFWAACDLAGRDVSLVEAEALLLEGAKPWNSAEEDGARRTIASAFSQSREAGQN
jgi:hypothetical protein